MNRLTRTVVGILESALFGIDHAALKYLIRSPSPLDPEATWQELTQPMGPLLTWVREHYPPAFMRRVHVGLKLRLEHVAGISEHYDISNAFYALFLDKKYMFYSCADFVTGQESLEEAQENKANFILNLLAPRKGERILELGCGWGAMLKRIFEATGDRENLSGYTISQEQVAYNEQHNRFDVVFRNFITTAYREETFDKIYSIGAWEHVRPHEIPLLLGKLFRALRPGGKLVQHFMCFPCDTVPVSAIDMQIFFPGTILASYRHQIRSAEAAGFRVTHRSLHDYRATLKAWHTNLAANRDQAIDLVGVRTYNKYLVFFPAAWLFHNDYEALVVRLVLEKP